MPTFTAIINARTQSSRVPNKLLRDFAGTTIVDIALEKLNRMDFVDERVLAVAEDVFIKKAKNYKNISIKKRSLNSVKKGIVDIKVHFRQYLEIATDYILFFNPCHPFIKVDTLRQAVEYAKIDCFNSYTSVIPSNEWIFDSEGNSITNKDPQIFSTNQGPPKTKAAHAFHFIRPQFFRETGIFWTFSKNDPALIPIPEEEALDIDTELEFTLCELLYRKKMQQSDIKENNAIS